MALRLRTVLLGLCSLVLGCSGDGKDGDDPPPSCEVVVTAPLTEVDATTWPAGLTDAIPDYNALAGRWTATSSCGGEVALKFVTRPQEELLVVQEPWVTTQPCGCTTDPSFEADSAYNAVAIHESFEFYVETFPDPALDGITIPSSGALFGPGSPLTVRACGVDDVDPVLQSVYDQVTTIVRVDAAIGMTGSLVLTPKEGEVEICELSGFTLVEAL